MSTEAGKISISQAARMYEKSRKAIYNAIKKHNISTVKSTDGRETLVQLTDLIAFLGEAKNNGTHITAGESNEGGRDITSEVTHITPILGEKIKLLEQTIEELRKDKEDFKQQLKEERKEYRESEKELREMLKTEQQKTQTLMLEYRPSADKEAQPDKWKRFGTLAYQAALIAGLIALIILFALNGNYLPVL